MLMLTNQKKTERTAAIIFLCKKNKKRRNLHIDIYVCASARHSSRLIKLFDFVFQGNKKATSKRILDWKRFPNVDPKIIRFSEMKGKKKIKKKNLNEIANFYFYSNLFWFFGVLCFKQKIELNEIWNLYTEAVNQVFIEKKEKCGK